VWFSLFNDYFFISQQLGIQVNPGHGKGAGTEKGVYLRLFSDFFISDIIVASPIGLRLAIESAGSNTSGGQKQTSSIGDFLSSVEMVLLHQADVLYMQNWEHVDYVLKATNKLPNSNHDTDFSRVRPYFLEGNGALHRQLLMTSAFVEPEMQAFFRHYGQSKAGFVRVKRSWAEGSITEVVQPVKQVFQLVPGVSSFAAQDDVRFAYFRDTVLSKVLQLGQKHTLIVTPSYLSYVRVRNELMNQQADAAYVCEYSRDSEISRGRSRFFHGKNDILLYSGRAHFFRRFLMKGARHIIFYSLPEYAHFYSEMVNLLDTVPGEEGGGEGSNSASCLVLYTPYERMALERLVGKERCDHMMSSKKATFMFC
jgi:U3 small nucleolar RNA-associated protein 25